MTGENVRDIVIDTAAEVLAVDRPALAAAESLAELPTYDSFRLVEIVERLEERFGAELDPADLTPGNLRRVESLCALFERAGARA
jgi:acyl carrier protein